RKDFDSVVEMHAEGVARRAGRLVGARLHRDGLSRTVSGRRGSRLAAMTSGGAIPDTAQYQVVAEPEGVVIGQLDEDFAVESLARERVRSGAGRGRAGRLVSRRRKGGARRAAYAGRPHRGALLRRLGRNAARRALPVRSAAEPRLRTGAAEELLPDVRLRAA